MIPWRWRTADPGLVSRHWPGEDEWVVYSPQSTDVHLLNAPAYDLIDALSAQSLTESDLVAALALRARREPDEELRQAVAATIVSLDAAGLIAPDVP